MDLRTSLIIAFVASVVASPVFAQTGPAPQPPQADGAKKAKDPNEMVCERQKEPGSRLAVAKVCHTRAEWADLRSQDRQMVDKAQTSLGMPGK
jgi:hypothetical protein